MPQSHLPESLTCKAIRLLILPASVMMAVPMTIFVLLLLVAASLLFPLLLPPMAFTISVVVLRRILTKVRLPRPSRAPA